MPALWITASIRPRRFTSPARLRVWSRSEMSPTMAVAPPSTRSPTASTRPLLRTLTTTSCPSSSSVCAAARPRPSAEPVMKTRAIRPLRASGAGVAAPAPLSACRDRSNCAGDECFADPRAGCEVLGEERLQLVERDQVGLVVEVDVAGVGDDVELLGLGRALVGVLAVVPRVRVLSRDEQDRPRRDPLEVGQQREVYEREAARRRPLGGRVRVVAARGGVELAELAGDRVGVLVEADRRVTRGQERHVGLECSQSSAFLSAPEIDP